jgi:hypothetical protein
LAGAHLKFGPRLELFCSTSLQVSLFRARSAEDGVSVKFAQQQKIWSLLLYAFSTARVMADIEIGDMDARSDIGLLDVPRPDYGTATTETDRRKTKLNLSAETAAGKFDGNANVEENDVSKITVYIEVVFMKLGEIDTIKETYTAEIVIQARWREPKLDGIVNARETNPDTVKWNEFWNPKLYIHNSIGELKETIGNSISYDTDNWEAYLVERRRVKGTFIENLELFTFPFDTQDLTIKVASERPDEELTLENDPLRVSTINVDMFVDEQEWRLYKEVENEKDQIDEVYDANTGHTGKRTIISCKTHATRRPGYYITNILVIMFFICSMVFTTFSVDFIKRENRLQLTFILLLTTMAFKSAVGNSLPRISYLTSLDVYIMASMTIVVLICVWHAIVPYISFEWTAAIANTSDKAVLIAFGGLFALVQIVFVLAVGMPYLRRRFVYEEKERKHKIKLQALKSEGAGNLRDIREASRIAARRHNE